MTNPPGSYEPHTQPYGVPVAPVSPPPGTPYPPAWPAPQPPRKSRTGLIVGLALAGLLVVGGAAVGVGLAVRGGGDSGVTACHMMAADKAGGRTPDDSRSAQEIKLLASSQNAALKRAAQRLGDSDLSVQMTAVGDLYAGCAAVGVPIN